MIDMAIQDKTFEFIKGFGEDMSSLELLLFFGRHPNARFNHAAIAHAVHLRRFDMARALRYLISKGFVVTCIENGITLYALTGDVSLRSSLFGLLDIDQHQWQLIAEKIIQTCDTV